MSEAASSYSAMKASSFFFRLLTFSNALFAVTSTWSPSAVSSSSSASPSGSNASVDHPCSPDA